MELAFDLLSWEGIFEHLLLRNSFNNLIELRSVNQRLHNAAGVCYIRNGETPIMLDLVRYCIRKLEDPSKRIKKLLALPAYFKSAERPDGFMDIWHHTLYEDETLLHRRPAVVQTLLECGINANICSDPSGNGALHFVCFFMSYQDEGLACLRLLLQHGCNIDKQNTSGETALHIALERPSPLTTATVRILLEFNADVNIANTHGHMPLHKAVLRYHDVEVVELLVKAGASITAKDSLEDTPRDYDMEKRYKCLHV